MAFETVLGDLLVRLTGDSTKFEKMMENAQRKIEKSSKRLGAAGRRMSLAITAPLAAIATASVKTFADFDDAMTKSTAIMGDVAPEMRTRMEELARELSRNGVTSATDLASSYFFLASAGKTAEQQLATLATVEKFAVAGAFDMALATDLLTDAQSALGLASKDTATDLENMTRVSDVLIKANTLANASAEQFAKSLTTKAAASLKLLNKDVEEGVAVLAAFADRGIKGEQAGEKLSIVLRDLQGAALKNTKVWKALNLQTFDATGKMRPIADIIEQLTTRFSGMSDEQKKSAATMLGFKDRSFSALQTLLGTSDQIRKYEVALRSAGGITDEVARKQLKSFSAQMKIVMNNIKDVGIEIGKELAPVLRFVGEKIRDVTNFWRSMSAESKRFVIVVAAIVAGIGPMLVFMGVMLSVVSTAITFFAGLSVATLAWVAALALVPLAIALVVDATTDAKLGVLDLVNSFRISGVKISTWMEVAALKIIKVWESFKSATQLLLLNVEKFFADASANMALRFLGAFRKVRQAFVKFMDFITRGAFSQAFGDAIAERAKQTRDTLEQIMDGTTARQKQFNKDTEKLIKDHITLQKGLDKELNKLFADDEKELRETEARAKSELEAKEPKVPGLPDIKVPEIEGSKQEAQDPSTQAFQAISLKRFALSGAGGLGGSGTKKEQDVTDKKAAALLKELVAVTKKKTVATLG